MRKGLSFILSALILLGLLPWNALLTVEALETTRTTPSATAEEINTLFISRSEGQHPRILADQNDFDRVRRLIQTDEYMKVWYARVYNYGVSALDTPASVYTGQNGDSILGVSRTASYRITWLAFLYQVSGERRFADRAVAEMLAVCSFPTWNPDHYLDVAQMAYGVGIGYDWLYHYMTQAQRENICQTLYKYAIVTSQTSRSYMNSLTNWNPWCHAGVSIAACAIYETYPQECSDYLSKAVTRVQKALAVLAPSGAYPEGPEYYLLGVGFMTVLFETLDSVLGTDFGLSEIEGIQECGSYLLAMNGNVASFNFGDANASIFSGALLHWFANRYHMPELSVYQREKQTTTVLYDEFLALLWYDPELVADMQWYDGQLDYLMYSDHYQSVASFRSEAGSSAEIYTAIKSGYNSTSHADMDVGTFVLDALGERWFDDLGKENYALTGTFTSQGYLEDCDRWDCYRKRAEGQNTLVINPGEGGGQAADAKCQIEEYESAYDGGYATVNMLDAYDSYGVTSATRGLLLFDDRSRVLLRDEIICSSPSEMYWFAHTQADITLSNDQKAAELKINGKTLLAQIAAPSNAVFTVMAADPLSTSPNPSGQKSRTEYQKLAIHLKNVTTANIAVVFTPVVEENDRNQSLPTESISNFSALLTSYDQSRTLTANSQGVYEISNVEQLVLFSEMVNSGTTFEGKTVKLTNDIDLKGRTFTPIGGCGTGKTFRGTFDGDYHTVRNVLIFEPNTKNVGFFGQVYLATIKNFGIENGKVFSGGTSGGLIGLANRVTVDNCFNRADVIAYGGTNGGLVGQISGISSISNSYNNASVNGTGSMAGGIVGYAASETTLEIKNCYHNGNLSDTLGRCGLIGFYNTKTENLLVEKVTVTNSYATVPIKSNAVTNNNALENYSSNATLSSAELVSAAVSLGSNFIYDCESENGGFPVFKWQCDTVLPNDLVLSTAAQLRLLAYNVNSGVSSYSGKTVRLANDIDLSSYEWVPIGGNSTSATNKGKVFSGTFDGCGFAVRNMSITTNRSYVGFFGSVQGAIKNFGVESGRVIGFKKVAGLAGYCTGTLTNCFNRAFVSGNSQTGGLIGVPDAVSITNCYNTGNVKAELIAGGLIGWFSASASGSVLTNCYNAGQISGTSAGGLAGTLSASATDICFVNCYSISGPALVFSTDGYTLTDCDSLSETELKGISENLGTGYVNDDVYPQNDGYPILVSSAYAGLTQTSLIPDSQGVYRIYTEQDLRTLSYMVNIQGNTFSGKTVCLCDDLDLINIKWIPIGGDISVEGQKKPNFAGTFDGGGHIVKNLTITNGNSYVGLFGFVSGAVIRDIGIASGVVVGTEKVGGVVGAIRAGSEISACYNKASVSGRTAVGGIVGMVGAKNCTIVSCYNTGSVSAQNSVGGIAGYFASDAENVVVQNCYNTGTESCGIVGAVNEAVTTAQVIGCYTVDAVALVHTPNSLTVTDSNQVSAKTLRTYANTLGAAYTEDYFVQNKIFPVLAWENAGRNTSLAQVDGVYQISCADDLRLLSYWVRKGDSFSGKQIAMQADLDMECKPWLSIGGYDETTSYTFKGSFDGQGHSISNLSVNDTNGYTGLFGLVSNATIQNIGIASGCILGDEKVGGIVGSVGANTTIRGCYNKATVYGNNVVGGIAGRIAGAGCVLENCYSIAHISGKNYGNSTGGMIGTLTGAAKNVQMKNCYGIGHSYGIIGIVNASATGSMTNCYAAGGTKLIKTVNSLSVTDSKLLSFAFLKLSAPVLGEAFDQDNAASNDGFPVLAWETGKVCYHQYAIYSYDDTYHCISCLRCGEKTTEKHTHFSFSVNLEDPTTHRRTCTVCGYYHYPSHMKYLTYTDNKNGTHSAYCQYCQYTETVEHTWELTEALEETCTMAGFYSYQCIVCCITKTETADALGHQYEVIRYDDTYHTLSCRNCGDEITEKHAPFAFDVNPDDATTHKRTCKTCGYYHFPSHVKYLTYTDNGDGTHKVYCKHCKYTDHIEHSYGEWETVTPATLSQEGEQKKTCSCGHTVSQSIPVLMDVACWNLTLGGDLSVNFMVRVQSDITQIARVKITVADKSIEYAVAELPTDSEDGYYRATVRIAAAQMNDTITIQFINGENKSETKTYTVLQYAQYVLENQEMSSYHALVKEMLNYGGAAQTYFAYNSDNLVSSGITDAGSQEIPKESPQPVKLVDEAEGIRFYGATLLFEHQIAVRFYFITDDHTKYSFTVDNEQYEPMLKDGFWCITVYGINPQDLDKAVTVSVNESMIVTYSPMNYMVNMNMKGTEQLKVLLKALYNYHLAALRIS